MKSGAGIVVVVVGLLAIGCASKPASGPVDVMDQVHAELAHTIDPIGEATLDSALLVKSPAPRESEAPAVRTWGVDESLADLERNPYTLVRYDESADGR